MAFFKSKTEKLAENVHEEQLYAQAGREVAEGKISAGLWTKAFTQANGDEQRAKVLYLKLRFEQLNLGLDALGEILARPGTSEIPDPVGIKDKTCHRCGGKNLSWSVYGTTYFCETCKETKYRHS